jgi:hypothetical protein
MNSRRRIRVLMGCLRCCSCRSHVYKVLLMVTSHCGAWMTFRNGPQRSPHMALALLVPWIVRRLPHHCQNYLHRSADGFQSVLSSRHVTVGTSQAESALAPSCPLRRFAQVLESALFIYISTYTVQPMKDEDDLQNQQVAGFRKLPSRYMRWLGSYTEDSTDLRQDSRP